MDAEVLAKCSESAEEGIVRWTRGDFVAEVADGLCLKGEVWF